MAEIIPFRGLLYNSGKVGDLNKVMAPPYDVISPKFQDELYNRHPNNIIRLILAKTNPSDTEGNDRYSRAAADLEKWLGEGVLAKDEKPAIYYYTQTYTLKTGKRQTRKGFIGLSKLVDFGKGVHPHERTLSGPKADRLKLMQACNANFSCIFSLYSDPKLLINATLDAATKGVAPIIEVADDDGIENKVWRIDDPEVIKKVTEPMNDKTLFIADGHHRYETALNYRNYMREKNPDYTGAELFNYVMMYFSNMDDEGMTIWPTHRVIHSVKNYDGKAFLAECAKYFDIEAFEFTEANEADVKKAFLGRLEAAGKEKIAMGLCMRSCSSYQVLTLKDNNTMDSVFGSTIPEVFKNLDVTVLHALVLNKILGITQEAQEKQENLLYVKSYDEALSACKKETNQLVFLLNSTKIEQVKAVAEAGLVMPQKSTYFYPKLLSGLTLNLLCGKAAEQAKI
ncbi:MAG: DUF1015 domain-containing protein [Deltaproteobacteria bacterium]|nr:DUF1015 domain-containing protein [Deltaproteobacteria bacterium]